MSRYCGEKTHDVESILDAAEHWRRACIENDGAVFIDDTLWSLEHFRALDQYFIQNLDMGDGSFYEKLESQLEPTVPEVKKLAAEMFWVMFLCPSNITPEKKREGIGMIWGWSGTGLPQDISWLSDRYLVGAGSAGTAYNTNRWREFIYFIRLMSGLKAMGLDERKRLLGDVRAMTTWLETLEENESRQFRHMFLFLLFPDACERVFGGTHRRSIVAAFRELRPAQVNKITVSDLDGELHEICKEQEASYGTEELDFYSPPLRNLWFESPHNSWLFSWNSTKWPWETLAADRRATHNGETVTLRWNCANTGIHVGDRVYLTRSGAEPRGVIAIGNVVTAPYQADHWDEPQGSGNKQIWYVDIAFSRIQDPDQGDPMVSQEELKKAVPDDQAWSPLASGIKIKPKAAGMLEKLWQDTVEKVSKPEQPTLPAMRPRNLIFYGPPGTGKTYELNRLKERYATQSTPIQRDVWLMQKLADVRWFDVIAAALYKLGGRAKVGDIATHEFVGLKGRVMERTSHIKQTIWATLQQHTPESCTTVLTRNRCAPFVFEKSRDSVWSFTDGWQETCDDIPALADSWERGPDAGTQQQRYEFVTFHQAYSYEDFLEGIRPVDAGEDGDGFSYRVVPGVFKRIVKKAKADPKQKYAIFIDEINRGNIAKIFGELITLMEVDKRAESDSEGHLTKGLELTLPYSGETFGVPVNLDIYGTMNTADRSIALIDTALRRRFRFKELMPNSAVINGRAADGTIDDGDGGVIDLRKMLDAMNLRIRFLLNRDMTLGHAYFCNVRTFADLKEVLLNQVIPLLQEYFYEDWRSIQKVFHDVGEDGQHHDPQIVCHRIVKPEEAFGFDVAGHDDLIEYRVEDEANIAPDAIRKIYEDVN
ncbi:EVE domain-containing protein [Desulfoluna spongiiphila]|uniref:EVE domain-containing protein n=1 Tax=Desulfoluna spongiiphila TaxID=419481 RepID=A0A1G5HPL6_9BACT|nr:EVE domain-containing protein [Desulfoluna spongiiphila]